MSNFIADTIRDMISCIPWNNVIRIFVLIVLAVIGFICLFGGLFWAIWVPSIWPLLLWIPAAFVVAVFATIMEEDEKRAEAQRLRPLTCRPSNPEKTD